MSAPPWSSHMAIPWHVRAHGAMRHNLWWSWAMSALVAWRSVPLTLKKNKNKIQWKLLSLQKQKDVSVIDCHIYHLNIHVFLTPPRPSHVSGHGLLLTPVVCSRDVSPLQGRALTAIWALQGTVLVRFEAFVVVGWFICSHFSNAFGCSRNEQNAVMLKKKEKKKM